MNTYQHQHLQLAGTGLRSLASAVGQATAGQLQPVVYFRIRGQTACGTTCMYR
jgi:hypothetical protein